MAHFADITNIAKCSTYVAASNKHIQAGWLDDHIETQTLGRP